MKHLRAKIVDGQLPLLNEVVWVVEDTLEYGRSGEEALDDFSSTAEGERVRLFHLFDNVSALKLDSEVASLAEYVVKSVIFSSIANDRDVVTATLVLPEA